MMYFWIDDIAYFWLVSLDLQSDEYFMKHALREAQQAFDAQEVPVGAVVVSQGRIIARAHNLTERLNDVTAHAEMQAVTAAANFIGGKYLNQCTLYVTLEPCMMCAGALHWAQLGKLVFGAFDVKKGFSLWEKRLLHPKTKWVGGMLEAESAALLKSFFAERR
jgi:tRNA(adenine34) deaminase